MSTAQIHIPGYVVGTWDIDPLHTEVGFSVRPDGEQGPRPVHPIRRILRHRAGSAELLGISDD